MSAPAFLRVADGATGLVRLVALGWIASIDLETTGPVLRLAVPDGAGGLVRVPVKGRLGDLTRQLDGLADLGGTTDLDAFVADQRTRTIVDTGPA